MITFFITISINFLLSLQADASFIPTIFVTCSLKLEQNNLIKNRSVEKWQFFYTLLKQN